MAVKCLGKMQWPCDHHNKHVEAAKKGWQRRRGWGYLPESEVRAFSFVAGNKVTQAHEHPEHKGQVRFRSGSKWYELPAKQWRELVKAGQAEERHRARQVRQQQGYERSQEADLRREERNQYRAVVREIQQYGGIRPNRRDARGRIPELEEWRELPRSVRTKKGETRKGFALDYVAQSINTQFPRLGIETDEDLRRYLTNYQRRERHRRAMR